MYFNKHIKFLIHNINIILNTNICNCYRIMIAKALLKINISLKINVSGDLNVNQKDRSLEL